LSHSWTRLYRNISTYLRIASLKMHRLRASDIALVAVLLVLCMSACVSSYPGGSAYYPCCCPDNPACRDMGTCFYCRNPDFTCNCAHCSCYTDNDDSEDTAAEDAFYADLLKRGFMKDYLRRHKGAHRQRTRRISTHPRRRTER